MEASPTNELITGLANNGPWALVAGFLLLQVLNAWKGDRDQLTQLLTDFKATLDALKGAVDNLSDRLDSIDHK